jgi:FkbM family methyltransferase
MSTLSTIHRLAHFANQGMSWKDKWLAFLIAGIGSLGTHRVRMRACFLRWINALGTNGTVHLQLFINRNETNLLMRQGNEADYLMGGEMVRGGYDLPDFEPKVIIDGGANIGMFSVHALSHFPKAQLISYEPDTVNFAQLQKNLSLNGLRAQTHLLGLWSRDTTLYYHARSSETGFIDEQPPGIAIPCVLPKIQPDCWLKLDIEGAEYEVLPALFQQQNYPRWISLEIHDYDTKGAPLLDLLRTHGYTIQGGEDTSVNCTVVSAYRSPPASSFSS